jgi:hypothetical protein
MAANDRRRQLGGVTIHVQVPKKANCRTSRSTTTVTGRRRVQIRRGVDGEVDHGGDEWNVCRSSTTGAARASGWPATREPVVFGDEELMSS